MIIEFKGWLTEKNENTWKGKIESIVQTVPVLVL